ncbi:hypothetical protein M8J76_012169 [Diaphorina citri]|nr:hypothetical protein M8J76_012169 [Diaphorina citri]
MRMRLARSTNVSQWIVIGIMMDDSGIDSDVKVSSTADTRGLGAALPITDSSTNNSPLSSPKSALKSSTNAIFQQKLGRKIAQYKSQNIDKVVLSNNLIPIQRLPVPNSTAAPMVRTKHPLVSWASSDSEEEITFFSMGAHAKDTKQTLTDTFSINELQLSDSDDDLGLLPPSPVVIKADNCCFRLGKHIRCSIL